MATCSMCGEPIVEGAKFCGICGAPAVPRRNTQPVPSGAAAGSSPPPSKLGGTQLLAQQGTPVATTPAPYAKPDPFAQTMMSPQVEAPALPAGRTPSVSPMAASVMATPAAVARALAPSQAGARVSSTPPPAPPVPTTPPPPRPPSIPPGAAVLVLWSDGNRYPGRVVQTAGPNALVAFSNGTQQWIDVQWLSPTGA